MWPGNQPALTGLRDALCAVLEYEIEARDPRAAALLLAEIDDAAPGLAARVEALRVEVERESRRLRALQIDQDGRIGQRTRVFVVGMLSLAWVLSPLGAWYWEQELTSWNQVQWGASVLLVVAAAVLWARESFSATPMNRTTAAMLLLVPICKMGVHMVFLARGGDFRTSMAMETLVFATLAATITSTREPRLLPTTLGFAVSVIAYTVTEIHPLLVLAAADAVLLVNVLIIWLPDLPREPTLRPDRDDRVG
ncbi:MAG: hypothetical protein H6737_13100 [Alphaproteobacteria bacterium]|nr:hypothetical protein [Alphaproteobacteria bacterium]